MANLLDAASAGFEDGTIGHWIPSVQDQYWTVANTTDEAHSGTHCLEVEILDTEITVAPGALTTTAVGVQMTAVNNGDVLPEEDRFRLMPVNPAGLYEVQFWYKAPLVVTANKTVFLGAVVFDADFTRADNDIFLINSAEAPGEWIRVYSILTVPAGRTWAIPYVSVASPTGPITHFAVGEKRWFDDFLFQPYVPPVIPPLPDPPVAGSGGWGIGGRIAGQ